MAKFFVGQRVRLVRPIKPKFLGLEGRIIKIAFYPKGVLCKNGDILSKDADCLVDFDDIEGDRTAVAFWQIEPILPDGHRAGEEGTCEPLDKLLSEVSREAV